MRGRISKKSHQVRKKYIFFFVENDDCTSPSQLLSICDLPNFFIFFFFVIFASKKKYYAIVDIICHLPNKYLNVVLFSVLFQKY